MFKRNGLPTRLLTAVLAIAMAWATTPTQGLAEALTTTPQTQTTTSASSDASSDASASKSTPTGEKDQEATSSKSTTAGSDSSTSNGGEKASSTDEKDSKSEGNSGAAAALAAPAAPSQDTSNSKDGQSTFTAHWTNAPDKEVSYTNADFKKDDQNTWTDFSCTPSENSLHKSILKVYLKLAGDSKTTYEPGSVKIYVPAGFYRGLDKDDPLLVACEDSAYKGKPVNQVEWMIPKAPDTNDVTDFNYVEETKDVNGQQVEYYVLQNAKDLSGATELDVDIDYRFRPTMLDVEPEKQADGSDMGIYQRIYPVSCMVNDNEVESMDLGVSVRTKVSPSQLTLSHASQDPNNGVFFTWDSAWGDKPKDADNYFYIVWYVNYRRGGASTMPYTYKLSVDASKTDGGELIGVKKYTGQRSQEAYEQPSFVLNRLDNSYSGIEGNLNLLESSWTGISNAPTIVDDYNANAIDSRSMGANSNWQNQVYALLFRYPLTKVSDAIKRGVDMASEGIKIDNGVILTETWQDRNVVTTNYGPSGDTSVKSLPLGGGSRGITKNRVRIEDSRYYPEYATQSLLAQGNDITLDDYALYSYNYDSNAKWDSEKKTYSAKTGFDITDGSYYLYSARPDYYGKAPGTDSIVNNKPMKLSDDEYSLTSFYVDDSEFDATYSQLLGWQRAARASTDYGSYEPVEIYIRKNGEYKFSKYGEIVRTSSGGYIFKSSDGDENVNNVRWNNRVSFPEGTVQVEVKQSSTFYASAVTVHFGARLHPDERMINRLNEDISAKIDSAIGGFASGVQSVEGRSLESQTAGEYWNYVSYELIPINSNVQFGIGSFTRSDDSKNDERTIPVSLDLYNQTNIRNDTIKHMYGDTEHMKNYIPTSGVFYSLLPAGTYVNLDEVSVGVRTGPMSNWSLNGQLSPLSERDIEQIQNWNGTGRTMLKISVTVPKGMERYIDYWAGLRVNYILHDTYTNIVDRGGRITNSAIFVNTTGDKNKDNNFNSNAKDSSYSGKGFGDWAYFQSIAQDAWSKGHQVATTQAVMDFGDVTALQAGFDARVSTDIVPGYHSSGDVYLGDRYTDRLLYTSAANTRTDNVILYDVLSDDNENSVGSFESIDVSSIEAKPTYDVNNSNTSDTCRPVVYYATRTPDDQTRSLDSGIWTTTQPDNLSKVRAVAVDCRKTDAGKDFVLDKKGTLVAYVHLKATTDTSCVGRTEKNEALISKRMFTGSAPAESDSVTMQTANRKVRLLASNLSIVKTCDTPSGTKDHPADIGNDANKKLTYTITVTNKAKDKTLPDVTRIHVKDALPEGLSLESPSDMTVNSDSLSIKDTKIGSQSVVSYQTGDDGVSFDIAKLPSGGRISITVPVVRKNPVKETTEYVNTATIETIGNAQDGQSSSTYHKTSVTTMPLAGAAGFAGLVVVGCAVLGASAVAWVRRRRRE